MDLTIRVPDEARSALEQRARERGCSDVSKYVERLISNDLVNECSGDQGPRDAFVEALKKVLELHPDDERARSQLQSLLQQRLDEKLQESGLLKEVKGPITDFTPYKERTLMTVGNKPLSEIVIEGRR